MCPTIIKSSANPNSFLTHTEGSTYRRIYAECEETGLPAPDFEQHGPHFVVTICRDSNDIDRALSYQN
jgi:predicted HTH transcriptional regulator